jgi:hypothetical protein
LFELMYFAFRTGIDRLFVELFSKRSH